MEGGDQLVNRRTEIENKAKKMLEQGRIHRVHDAQVFLSEGDTDNYCTIIYADMSARCTCEFMNGNRTDEYEWLCSHAMAAMATRQRNKRYGRSKV